MGNEWYEVPVRVTRNGETFIVPANQVQDGDIIYGADGFPHITTGFWPDDEEEIAYLAINNGIDHWPAACFMGE